MKTRGLFLSALLMGAVMAGCSQDEVLDNNNERTLSKSDNYIAVNIVAPSDTESRGEDGGFKAGDENAVKDAWFVFFAENGNYIDAVQGTGLTWSDGTGTVEKISSAMIVLSNPNAWPTQVVALLNTGYKTKDDFKNITSLAMLRSLKGNYRDYSTTGFTMSNSVYIEGNEIKYSTPLLDTHICTSKEDALKNPVSIPVERVLAKVEAKKALNFTITQPDGNIQLDGQDFTFKPEITGMALVHENSVSFLVKELANAETILQNSWAKDEWNDPKNFRSYWAMSCSPETVDGYETYSYEEIVKAGITDNYSTYCHENTNASIGGISTKLLVTAQFKSDNNTYEDVIKYNGTYYTADGLKNYFNAQYFANVTHGNSNSNDWRNYMKFVASADKDAKAWEVELTLEEAPTPNENVVLEDILANVNSKLMSQWTEGKCYYYVDVEHFGEGRAKIGVVRNHWYDITLNSIKGLGTPVFEPKADITPERPDEEEYFVAAEVKILKWKMVSQEVDLK